MPSSSSPQDKISARIKAGDTVILGLSGGPDSVFLFHLLCAMPAAPRLIAAHVNYGLRGRDSELDRCFVEKLCASHNVELEILDLGKNFDNQKKSRGNLEEKCRQVRYLFLEEVRRRRRAKAVLVAHQLDDQLETFLLNLTRGCSLRGFRAMREYDPDRHLLRPLLDTPKVEILAWLKKHHLIWRLDRSNFSEQLNRNLIRSRVIPILQKINPSFLDTAGNALRDLAENIDLIENLAVTWLKKNLRSDQQTISFPLEKFLEEPPILQKHILRELHSHLHGGSLTRPALEQLIATLQKKNTGLRKEFGPQTFLQVTRPDPRSKRIVVLQRKFH